MIRINQIKVPVLDDSIDYVLNKIINKLRIKKEDIIFYDIVRKSIDARDKNNIYFVYEINLSIKNEDRLLNNKDVSKVIINKYQFPSLNRKINDRPIIIGSGPAGLFCAYMLASSGLRPIVFERGDDIDSRVIKVEDFFNNNKLDPNSNIQFGEGGAGTFSDGKLNTQTKDKFGRIDKVFDVFVENGAPEEIKYIHNPHIGTDILRKVIKNMREKIISFGGEFHFRSLVTDLIVDSNHIKGVVVNDSLKYYSSYVVLAIGHSARDTFYMLNDKNVLMKPKNFAVGVRIEHPREMIDNWQYGKYAKALGSANYKLTYQTSMGRSVYSFCMCPGGFVVNASSEEGRVVVNGMSNYKRDEKNSNSAIVVNVTTNDLGTDLFSGVEFQRKLEELAYKEGKGFIPVQLYKDFKNNVISSSLGDYSPNTKGNYNFGNLRNILPEFISSSIIEAMPHFDYSINGFARDDAILLGVEARTSSPIIIERNDILQSNIIGLYPCGEGAGYAGGITTAAIDGIKVAEKIVENN